MQAYKGGCQGHYAKQPERDKYFNTTYMMHLNTPINEKQTVVAKNWRSEGVSRNGLMVPEFLVCKIQRVLQMDGWC